MMTDIRMSGMRARMLSDLTRKLADERRKNDEAEANIKQLQEVITYLMSKLGFAVVLTDEELAKASRKYELRIYNNIRNEMVIKAERKRNPQGNADSESVTSEATI